MNELNPSVKHHTFIGIFISLWIFVFTFYIKPFDSGAQGLYWWWVFLSMGFSIIAIISYIIITILQNSIYQRFLKWNIGLEISAIFLFHFINLYVTYIYYKSPFINGIWTFSEYFGGFLKVAIILTPILIFSRWYLLRLLPPEEEKIKKEDDILTIKGDYKLDFLKVHKSDLVCISKSQNYIEVFFIQNGMITSKLIRSSLKKVQRDLFFLVQVHRSHLINPLHFKYWKNQNTIFLNQIEIPVSKNYKDNLLSL